MIDLSPFAGRLRYRLFDDAQRLAEATAARTLTLASEAIARRGAFRMVLAGGTTPQAAYRLLATMEADWSRWHIYFGDERCLPADDDERNSRMAAIAWLDQVSIPPGQIHPIPAERGAVEAAAAYEEVLKEALPFDLVLLGMGEDGHIASLFPGQRHDPAATVVAVHGAPKPPPERVSLNVAALEQSHAVVLLVSGAGKRAALSRWRDGEPLPVATLHPACGLELWLDRSAIEEA